MPGLTIATDGRPASASVRGTATNHRRSTSSARTSSPQRPPVSPITPTLGPAQMAGGPAGTTAAPSPSKPHTDDPIPDFALGRPVFTHTSQTDQVGITPPPAQPINFDENPDVLALQSAISILQLQRQRATADIQKLNRIKAAALADPAAFIADLAADKVRVEGDPLMSGPGTASSVGGGEDDDNDDEEDSEEDSEDDEEEQQEETSASSDTPMTDATPHTQPPKTTQPQKNNRQRSSKESSSSFASSDPTQNQPQEAEPIWRTLPKPQTVVRCPPINWAQYGVVGESLDKLHAEQLAAPTPGTPAVLGPGGTYHPPSDAQPHQHHQQQHHHHHHHRHHHQQQQQLGQLGQQGGRGAQQQHSQNQNQPFEFKAGGGGSGGGGGYQPSSSSAGPAATAAAAAAAATVGGGGGSIIGGRSGGGPGERLVGVAAPYVPGRDKIAKKGKGGKR
ncbi:hypothetical protein VTK26DRAFT_9242 [Humicola hyalothermophila]